MGEPARGCWTGSGTFPYRPVIQDTPGWRIVAFNPP
jgi:hypothetical protein